MQQTAGALLIGLSMVVVTVNGAGLPTVQRSAVHGEAVVLVTTYADGRTVHSVVSSAARTAWTPLFPKLPGYQPVAGDLPVTAIKYQQVLGDEGAATVVVSVLRGQAHEQEQPVATVVVAPGARVAVDALRNVGVAPVVMTLTSLSPATLYQPQVVNRTAGLDVVNIEVRVDPSPRYEITVKNLSSQPAVNFHIVAYREERRALAGNRGNTDASPIVAPGATYLFTLLPAGGVASKSGGWTPASHDTIEIAAVLWEDGTIEGDPAPMASALSVYIGRATQLARAVAVLKAARSISNPAAMRTRLQVQLERLSIEPDENVLAVVRNRLRDLQDVDEQQVIGALRSAMVSARNGILDDLREAPSDALSFERWRGDIVALYEQWESRLARR